MGNALLPLRVYNGSDYEVKVEVPYGIACGSWNGETSNTICKGGHVRLETGPAYYVQITVYLLRKDRSVCKKCSFNSYYYHSWIVTNEYVYRQEYGKSLSLVAKDADNYPKERSSSSDFYVMRYTLTEVKQPSNSTAVTIYNASKCSVMLDVPSGVQSDTGSLTKCKIERLNYVRLEECTVDDLEITIRLLKDDDKEFKKCTFTTHNDYSWVVTDDYVYRQKPGGDLDMVADKADHFAEGKYFGFWKNVLRYTLKEVDPSQIS